MARARRSGLPLVIDAFGTGHSSPSDLRRFNVDTLKSDNSFIASLPDSMEDAAIADAVSPWAAAWT